MAQLANRWRKPSMPLRTSLPRFKIRAYANQGLTCCKKPEPQTVVVFKHERKRHSFANGAIFAAHSHQPIKATPSYQRVVQSATVVPGLGFWDPDTYWGNDAFWDGIDDPFWADSTTLPSITCSAGSSRFNLVPLTDAIAQLPTQTLQMNLIFSNGSTSQWKLGQKTVQALKALLAIRQTSSNDSKAPAAQ